jgi:hypothetical protein
MVHDQGLHQSGSLLLNRTIVSGVWTSDCAFYRSSIADTRQAAEFFQRYPVRLDDIADR